MRYGFALMLLICSGFLIWSSAFIMLYAGHAYMCEREWNAQSIHMTIGILISAHIILCLIFLKKFVTSQTTFADIIKWLLIAGLIAILVVFLPALKLTPCL